MDLTADTKGCVEHKPSPRSDCPTCGQRQASEGEDAAQDVLDAIGSGDAEALHLALKRHYLACESDLDLDMGEEE